MDQAGTNKCRIPGSATDGSCLHLITRPPWFTRTAPFAPIVGPGICEVNQFQSMSISAQCWFTKCDGCYVARTWGSMWTFFSLTPISLTPSLLKRTAMVSFVNVCDGSSLVGGTPRIVCHMVVTSAADWQDPSHNMCSSKNNKPDATCSAAGGPESIESCPGWFKALWDEQKEPWTLVEIGR